MAPVIVIWHVAAVLTANHALLPSPIEVGGDLWALLTGGEILHQAWTSVWRLVVAFSLAAGIGIPLGVLIGRGGLAEEIIDPLVELLRPISSIAWIPLAL